MTDISEEDRKAAMEWLEQASSNPRNDSVAKAIVATLKAMLAEPRMPEEPTTEIRDALKAAWMQAPDTILNDRLWDRLYRAIYAHLTKPKTKTVEVWRVEWASLTGDPMVHQSLDASDAEAVAREKVMMGRQCVRVTGPHQQEIPA